jgi:hypothetical protein
MTAKPDRSQVNTGPKTLRHGLTGQIVVMPDEDREIYLRHIQSFTEHFRPLGVYELQLVQVLADTSWRLNRIAALENNLTLNENDIDQTLESVLKSIATLSLHTQRLTRVLERTAAQLRELQETRLETSSKCTSPKENPTTPPEMGSFFQKPKSAPPPAKNWPSKPPKMNPGIPPLRYDLSD